MKRLLGLGVVVLLFAVGGCAPSADSLMQEDARETNDLANALETRQPEAAVKDLAQKRADTEKKLADLKLSDDEKKRLLEKYGAEGIKAMERLLTAMEKSGVRNLPGVDPSLLPPNSP